MAVLSDAVTRAGGDLLGFDRYIVPLISILADEYADTPFTIGVFGAWGSGKSTLLSMLDERLHEQHPDAFVRVHFNPWIHRREPNMLVPLLHTFHDALAGDKKSRFAESAKKIGSVLLRLGADLFLKYITADAVSLEKLEKIEQTYISERGKLQSEIRNLRRTLQGEMDAIAKKGARVVLFVDDLDRCEPSEIIDVLEAIKLFFDLRHVFILLAVDKEIIDRGIEIRYSKFAFATGRESAIGAEYLEKMVQLPLQLFPLHQTQVRAFIDKMCVRMKSPKDVLERVDLLEKICAPNPRKLKRILNILTVTMAMASKLKPALELEPETIARLVVLQVQSGDLYANVIKNPELLVAMELVFAGKFKLEDDEKFSRFGTRRAVIQKLAKEFHRPDGYLPQIFSGSRFETLSDRLPTYLSLLGG